MAQLFISYSTRNADFARYLRGLLQDAGFDVWMDEAKLSAGQSWTDTLEANITACSAFVIIMSPEAKASEWVRRERLLAEKLRKPMFPILFSGDAWWDLANIQYEDMRAGLRATLSPRLIEALRLAVSGILPVAQPESTGTHTPVPAMSRTDSRKLEAAMPAETKSGSDTEVWAKISLPNSEGLRGELPATVPSGDVIQKGDTRASTFPIRFPIDPRTGQLMSAQAELRLSSNDFRIASPGERVEVEIPPDADSRTVIFTLEAHSQGKTSGRARVVIDLIYDAKIIAQVSVSTVLVERVTAAIPAWNLAALGYVAPATGTVAPGAPGGSSAAPQPSEKPAAIDSAPTEPMDDGAILSMASKVLDDLQRAMTSAAQPSMPTPPMTQPTVTAPPPPSTTPVVPDQEVERGGLSAGASADDEAYADADEPLPTYEQEKRKREAPAPKPVVTAANPMAQPQYNSSAQRSSDISALSDDSSARRAPRRASNTPLRLASIFAALGLVFVVMLAITRTAAPPPATSAARNTQFALLPTETFNALAATSVPATQVAPSPADVGQAPIDIAVAPMLNCFGSPGTHLTDALKRADLNAVLLDSGFSNSKDARRGSDAPVIAWGVCRGNTLILTIELVHMLHSNADDPQSIMIQVPSASLAQDDSHAVQLAGAVASYAHGSGYSTQAQVFASLSQEAINDDEHAALLKLWQNSLNYAG